MLEGSPEQEGRGSEQFFFFSDGSIKEQVA
jgi:hypothetical protein